MELGFGQKTIMYDFSEDNILGSLVHTDQKVRPLKEILENSILNPLGKPRLSHLLRKNKPGDIVIIVSDQTRAIADYDRILSFLIGELIDGGVDENNVEFMVALGTHRKHTPEEQKELYKDLITDFKFSFHDCRNDLVSIGKTSTGLDVQVNKRVRAADFVIATGRINFHYMAGFSGGRKSILPGIASYETIRNNHCKLKRDGVSLGRVKDNIIAQEMDEAAQLFGIDYLFNVIESSDKRIIDAFCGDALHAHRCGIDRYVSSHVLKIQEPADCVIVSAGGHPKDRTFYSGHKVLNHAVGALRKGGSMILVIECSGGVGNKEFERYMTVNDIEALLHYPETEIEIGGHRAFQTARLLNDHKIYVVSNLDPALLVQMNFIPAPDIESAMAQVRKDHGPDPKIYFIPEGRSVLAAADWTS
jgi:nickel-dependent lactate racemase